MHCHLAVSISSKILFLPYKIFLKKNKTLPIQILQSIIWHQYRLSTINHFHFLFIHSEASIGVLVKRLFEFLDQPSISISKNSFSENFGKLSSENIHFGVLYSSTFTGLLGVGKTTYLERFISILEVQKKVCLRNFRQVLRCAHAFRWLI